MLPNMKNIFICGLVLSSLIAGADVYAADQVVTNNNNSGAGSLRQAIYDVGSGEEITFDADYTITLSSQLNISKNVTITGRGAGHTVVQANADPDVATYRVLYISSGSTVTISGMTIRHGKSSSAGGIYNTGNLTINDCAITDNVTTSGGGGAMYSGGGDTLTINNSTISGNSSASLPAFTAGGIYTLSTTTLTNCTISNNTSVSTHFWSAGGLGKHNATATITNCTIANNSADAGAGGYASIGVPTANDNFKNVIIANNTSSSGIDDFYYATGTVNDNGYNIIETQNRSDFVDGVNGCHRTDLSPDQFHKFLFQLRGFFYKGVQGDESHDFMAFIRTRKPHHRSFGHLRVESQG